MTNIIIMTDILMIMMMIKIMIRNREGERMYAKYMTMLMHNDNDLNSYEMNEKKFVDYELMHNVIHDW